MKYSVALFFFAVPALFSQAVPPQRSSTIVAAAPASTLKPLASPNKPQNITGKSWGSVANPGGPPPRPAKSSNGPSKRPIYGYAYPVYVPVYVPQQDLYPPGETAGRPATQNTYATPSYSQPQQSTADNGETLTTYQAPASNAYAEVPEDAAPVKKANYYLIAYKDHHVYTAVTYWVESTTLHYLTTDGEHNQAPVSEIDQEMTKRLNDGRDLGITASE